MRMHGVMFCILLSVVLGGCSSHRSVGSTSTGDVTSTGIKVVAHKAAEFEREGIRLCPFGFDILGPPQVFKEGKENIRYIRCRLMKR